MSHDLLSNRLAIYSALVSGCMISCLSGCQSANTHQGNAGSASNWPVNNTLCSDECVHPYDFSPSAVPAPMGTYVNAWNAEQIASARENRYVVQRHEWYSGGTELGPAGRNHVRSISTSVAQKQHPVIIETEEIIPNRGESLEEAYDRIEQLNDQRRIVVVSHLQSEGIENADELVKVMQTNGVGVYGIESPGIFNRITQGIGNSGRGGNGNGNRNGSSGNRGTGRGF